jgi:hypothetical protein
MKGRLVNGQGSMDEDGSAPFTIDHSPFTAFTSSFLFHRFSSHNP